MEWLNITKKTKINDKLSNPIMDQAIQTDMFNRNKENLI